MRRMIHWGAALVLASALGAPIEARAQLATIYGSLGNFDVVNDTGHDANGFEIQLEGLSQADIYYAFTGQRYGSPAIVPYTTGVFVRWTSAYDAATQSFTQRTIPHPPGTSFAGTCYQWYPATYDGAGCEHFGVSLRANATRTTYRWLAADPGAPGALAPVDPPMPIAAPVYTVQPPAQVGDPPLVVAEVQAPEPAESPELYGDAQWMKVFVTQSRREVQLDQLVADDAIVPQDDSHVEVQWDIVQDEPVTANGNHRRSRKRNQGGLDPETRSIIRRYELYSYTGAYDPVTHEALCADGTCTAPSDGELGDFVSAQMTAVNVQSNSVTVSKSGNGGIDSSDKLISCGSKCAASYEEGTAVTLTAKPGSGATLLGWVGTCSGVEPSCTVTATGHVQAAAVFSGTSSGSGRCGLMGIEGFAPIAWFAWRRGRRLRGAGRAPRG